MAGNFAAEQLLMELTPVTSVSHAANKYITRQMLVTQLTQFQTEKSAVQFAL